MSTQVFAQRICPLKPSPIREVMTMIAEAQKRGLEIANFSVGRPDFDTPVHIKQATVRALERGMVHYVHTAGIIELREAVCHRLQQDFALKYLPEEVIITVGASEAIYTALQTILDPGDTVLAPEPMYVYYRGWAELNGARFMSIPLREEDGFKLKASEVAKRITPQTKALIINSPHNPTGQVFEREELAQIARMATEKDFWVIADDIYNYMIYDDTDYASIASFPGMKERSIVIGSLSKTYAMDGWRVGYLLGPKHFLDRAFKVHQHVLSSCNTFAQYGAIQALSASQDCVKEMVVEFGRRRQLLMSRLDELGMEYIKPRGAFYVFPCIKKYGFSSMEMSHLLLEKARVGVVPGNAFGPGGEGFIRMAYSTSHEEIDKGMDRMGSFLKTLRTKG